MMILFLSSFFLLFAKRTEMSETQRFMYYFAAVTFALNTFLMITGQNDEYADRYIAIGMVPSIMLIDLVYKICLKDKEWKKIAGAAVIIFFLLAGEMSDGTINMTSLDPNADSPVVFRWLTDKRLIGGKHDRAFLVLTSQELDMYEKKDPVYSDEYFSVFDVTDADISFEE